MVVSKLKKISIHDLGLSAKTSNILASNKILTLKDLVSKTEGELLKIPNFGRRASNEVRDRVSLWNQHYHLTRSVEAAEITLSSLQKDLDRIKFEIRISDEIFIRKFLNGTSDV